MEKLDDSMYVSTYSCLQLIQHLRDYVIHMLPKSTIPPTIPCLYRLSIRLSSHVGSVPSSLRPYTTPHPTVAMIRKGEVNVDAMMLYSDEAKNLLGGLTDKQMETKLIKAIASTNEAFVTSDISLHFSLVRAQQVQLPVITSKLPRETI